MSAESAPDESLPLATPPTRVEERYPALRAVRRLSVETKDELRLIVHDKPSSLGADRFRYLRHRLRQQQHQRKLKSLVLTSPLPQDGKSTLAMNLASALIERGRKSVLYVEADLYHPTVTSSFDLNEPLGFVECLEEALDPLEVIVRLDPLGWYLLPSGRRETIPAELLQSDAFPALLQRLESNFDWIIFDTPPVLPLTDTVLISGKTDATLLVVRAGLTQRESIEDALNLIGQERALGIVLNDAAEMNSAYAKYYRSYYNQA